MADNSTKSIGRDLMERRIKLVSQMVDSLADKIAIEKKVPKETALIYVRENLRPQIDYLVARELDTINAIEQIMGDKSRIERLANVGQKFAESVPKEDLKNLKQPDYSGQGGGSKGKEPNVAEIANKVQKDPSYQSNSQLANKVELGDEAADQELIERNNARETKSQRTDRELSYLQEKASEAEYKNSDELSPESAQEAQEAARRYEEKLKEHKEAKVQEENQQKDFQNQKPSSKADGAGGFYEKGVNGERSDNPQQHRQELGENPNSKREGGQSANGNSSIFSNLSNDLEQANKLKDGTPEGMQRYNAERDKILGNKKYGDLGLRDTPDLQSKLDKWTKPSEDGSQELSQSEMAEYLKDPMGGMVRRDGTIDPSEIARFKKKKAEDEEKKNQESLNKNTEKDLKNQNESTKKQSQQVNFNPPENNLSDRVKRKNEKDGDSDSGIDGKSKSENEKTAEGKGKIGENAKSNSNDDKNKSTDSKGVRGQGDMKSGGLYNPNGKPIQIGGKTILPGIGGTSNRDFAASTAKVARGGITNVGNSLQTGGDKLKKTGEGVQKKADELGKNKLTSGLGKGLGKVAGGITSAGAALQDAGSFVKNQVKQAVTRAVISGLSALGSLIPIILIAMFFLVTIITVIIALCHGVKDNPALDYLRKVAGLETLCKGLGVNLSAGCDTSSSSSNSISGNFNSPNNTLSKDECAELRKYKSFINEASSMYGIPAEFIGGFMSRETRVGLLTNGCAGYGDNGNGHGIGQIDPTSGYLTGSGTYQPVGTPTNVKDKNGKTLIWSDCRDGIVFIGFYLRKSIDTFGPELKAKGVTEGSEEYWRQIANTYNRGKICTIGTDDCTTNGDYGSDVLGRAGDAKACLSSTSSSGNEYMTNYAFKQYNNPNQNLDKIGRIFGVGEVEAADSDKYRWLVPGGSYNAESLRANGVFTQGDSSGGVDITLAAPGKQYEQSRNTPIIGHEQGIVTHVVNNQSDAKSGYGNQVGVYYPKLGVTAIYSHLETTNVKLGDSVSPGGLLGKQGSTGSTDGGDDGTGKGFVHIDLRLYNGKVDGDPGGVMAWQDPRYSSFVNGMLDYYNANEAKILANNFSPTAPGANTSNGKKYGYDANGCLCEIALGDMNKKYAKEQNNFFGFSFVFGESQVLAQTSSIISDKFKTSGGVLKSRSGNPTLIILHHTATSGSDDDTSEIFKKGIDGSDKKQGYTQFFVGKSGGVYRLTDDNQIGEGTFDEQSRYIVRDSNGKKTGESPVDANALQFELVYSPQNGESASQSQIKNTASAVGELALKYNLPPTAIMGHSSVQPQSRSNEPYGLIFGGVWSSTNITQSPNLESFVRDVRAKGAWKDGEYKDMTDKQIANIIYKNNLENERVLLDTLPGYDVKEGDNSQEYIEQRKKAIDAELAKLKDVKIPSYDPSKGGSNSSSSNSADPCVTSSSNKSGDFPGLNDPTASVFPITNAYEGPGPQQSFGACRGNGGSCPHKGLDLTPPFSISDSEALQLPILAFRSGTVSLDDAGYNGIYIKHDDGTASYYLHSSQVLVKNGEKVKAGQIISKMGGQGPGGRVYPIHLHFELYNSSGGLVDPANVLLDSNNQPNKANVKIIGNPQGLGGGL